VNPTDASGGAVHQVGERGVGRALVERHHPACGRRGLGREQHAHRLRRGDHAVQATASARRTGAQGPSQGIGDVVATPPNAAGAAVAQPVELVGRIAQVVGAAASELEHADRHGRTAPKGRRGRPRRYRR